MNPKLNKEFFDAEKKRFENDKEFLDEKEAINKSLSIFQQKFGGDALSAVKDDEQLIKLFFQNENGNSGTLYYHIVFDKKLPVRLKTIKPQSIGAAYIRDKSVWFDSKNNEIQKDRILEIAKAIKSFVIEVTKIVKDKKGDVYKEINIKLNSLFGVIQTKQKAFYGKYLGLLFPDLFPPFYNQGWQMEVLDDDYDVNNICENYRKLKLMMDENKLDSYSFGSIIWSDSAIRESVSFNPSLEKSKNKFLSTLNSGEYYVEDLFDRRIVYRKNIDSLEGTLKQLAKNYKDDFEYDKKNKMFIVKNDNGIANQHIETDDPEDDDYVVAGNQLYYGIPGCGKSFLVDNLVTDLFDINNDSPNKIRTTFYLDYSYNDFVGQLMPKTNGGTIEYKIKPGPFAIALSKAYEQLESDDPVVLIIEEINRGNAPAIFGDIFQLLDRDEDGESVYEIMNPIIEQYLEEKGIKNPYGDRIKLPKNLWIFATMNSSDQNVFKLDTAFKRRWDMKRITNNSSRKDALELNNFNVPGTNVLWVDFVDRANKILLENDLTEDRQLGYWFLIKNNLDILKTEEEKKEYFANKVLEYLWNDVLKFHDKILFNSNIKSFDDLVNAFIKNSENVFDERLING